MRRQLFLKNNVSKSYYTFYRVIYVNSDQQIQLAALLNYSTLIASVVRNVPPYNSVVTASDFHGGFAPLVQLPSRQKISSTCNGVWVKCYLENTSDQY